MLTRTLGIEPHWQWRRVAAWTGSVTAHLVVCALLLAPLAEPLLRQAPLENPATRVELLERIPPPPQPPEPMPPPRSEPVHTEMRRPPTPAAAAPVIESPTAATAPMAPVSSSSSVVASDPPSSSGTPAGSGATQTLAYAGALRTVYPAASARAREQGSVLLRVLVDATGAVQEVRIERSSGHARLDAAARDAVLHGRFRPVMRDGAAIPAWGLVPIEFRLDRR